MSTIHRICRAGAQRATPSVGVLARLRHLLPFNTSAQVTVDVPDDVLDACEPSTSRASTRFASRSTRPSFAQWRQWLAIPVIALTAQVCLAQDLEDDPAVGVIKRGATDERSFEGVKIVANKMSIDVTERFSKDLEFRERLLRVDGHDPEIISVVPLGEYKLRIRGLKQGITTMVCTGESGQKYVLEVYVSGDARLLQSVLKHAFPDSAIDCRALIGGNILLTGYVTDNQTIQRVTEVAELYAPTVINHMRVGGPQEVQLRCKIMEVQRSKLRTFGVNLQAMTKSAVIASAPGSITPISSLINPIGGPPSATMNPSSTNPLSLAAGFSNNQFAFDLFVQALKEEGLLKVMSEPILVARSGEAARLSDGGEFPIPVPGGLGTVTIEFREFGVILEMLPIVISPTRVKQQVTAEVSDKDTANAITLQGTTVPGLTKRRVQSTVDMNFGDTMVVAGIVSTRVVANLQKTPLIGEFPGVGTFFSKKVYQQTETELVILITPEYGSSLAPDQVPLGGPGQQTTAPTDRELYLHGLIEVPKFGPDCGPDCQGQIPGQYGVPMNGNGGPVIAPTPAPACNPSSGGLIAPPGADSPGVVVPPPTEAESNDAKRNATTSNWPSRSATKTKEPAAISNSSTVLPAGYKRNAKSDASPQEPTGRRKNKTDDDVTHRNSR